MEDKGLDPVGCRALSLALSLSLSPHGRGPPAAVGSRSPPATGCPGGDVPPAALSPGRAELAGEGSLAGFSFSSPGSEGESSLLS